MATVWKISLVFLSVICLSQAECPPLWSVYQGNCYRFFGQRKSWHDAEDHCNGFFTSKSQAHLATIRDSSTNHLLLTDQGTLGDFTWISDGGRDVPPNVWIPGQPDDPGNDEDCVDFWNRAGTIGWNDESCDRENHLHDECRLLLITGLRYQR